MVILVLYWPQRSVKCSWSAVKTSWHPMLVQVRLLTLKGHLYTTVIHKNKHNKCNAVQIFLYQYVFSYCRNSLSFIIPKCALPCSQEQNCVHYFEAHESPPHPPTYTYVSSLQVPYWMLYTCTCTHNHMHKHTQTLRGGDLSSHSVQVLGWMTKKWV